jgi:hypothetical protein
MNDSNHRDEIVKLEAHIDDLAAVLIALLVGAIQFDPAIIAVAVTAVLGGIVAAGSNYSTAKEAMHELTIAEAKRTALIGQIDLRLVELQ